MVLIRAIAATIILVIAGATTPEAGFCAPVTAPQWGGGFWSRPRGGASSTSTKMQAPLQKIDPPPLTLSGPVFSLATLNDDGSTNMNVLTYTVPVGLKPTRTWVLSLFQGTLSHENFEKRGSGVLQLLRRTHLPIVPILGKQCGRDFDKKSESAEAGFAWGARDAGERSDTPLLLPGCAAYYPITKKSDYINAGEHDAVFVTCCPRVPFSPSASIIRPGTLTLCA
jgi:hypothetical protein